MGLDRFSAVTRRLSGATRRAFLGAGVGSGVAALLGYAAVDGKKKKKCKKCKECQSCRKGKCRPQPEGALCAHGNHCLSGVCTCELLGDDCPAGCSCTTPNGGGTPICVRDAFVGQAPNCDSCPAGTVRCDQVTPVQVACYPACGTA